MYKPSKIKHPSPRKNNKNGDPAYASSGTTPAGPAYAGATASTTESSRAYATPEPPAQDRPAEETRKPVVNEDEQKKVVNQPVPSTATNSDDSEES
jgi:hypothetical protein